MIYNPQLLVYKASAGSGKTFTLAVEYIKLLINNPKAYRNILAVTFTNKATTEMKERILSQLYGIWKGEKDSDAYLNKIKEDIKLPDEDIRKKAGTALNMMIHDYSRFRVETIDSFFQSVMRNMARELELGANLNIELDNISVLSDAVDSMIEKLDRKSPVLYWLLDYIEEKISDDKKWKVDKEIKDFGRHIFNENFIEKGVALREKLKDKDYITKYRKDLTDIYKEAESQIKSIPEQFYSILDMNGLTEKDFKRGATGIAGYFGKLNKGIFDDGVVNATVLNCLESEDGWVNKTSKRREEIVALVNSELIPLLEESENLRKKNNMIINSCNLSLKYINNIRLLSNIDEEVRTLNYENNRFLLADTNALLHKLINKDDPSFVFEKLGTTIKHVMIDEFQDTSKMQWDNFKLLLLEGLSQGSDSLIVGDVKQSIYRWRNGDWGILNGLNTNIDIFPVTLKNLQTNRRSSGNIIEFNNIVFTEACKILNDIYVEDFGKNCDDLLKAYNDVCQETDKNKDKGYVKATFISKKEDISYTDDTLQQLAAEVEKLIENGISQKEIAILVRKNKNIPLIADYFDKNTNYRIVSDEAFRMDASLAICMIIDALTFLANQEDNISKAQLALSYQNDVLKKNIDVNTILFNNIEDYLPQDFILTAGVLSMMPLYELIEKIFNIFHIQKIEKQDAYLCAFFDAVTNYLQNNSSDISSFLTFWQDKLCYKTIPSGEMEGIRILSVHKSKGLEYHTVLIPFCDWKMENETYNDIIWCSPLTEPFNNLDIVPVNYSSIMKQSVYMNDYIEERLQLWVDNLNILYVAFTRAKNNLIIWCNGNKAGTVSKLLSDVLENVSAKSENGGLNITLMNKEKDKEDEEDNIENNNNEKEKAEDIVYEGGSLFVPERKNIQQESNNILLAIPQQIELHLESIDTRIEFQQSNKSAEFIDGDEEGYIKRGQLLHKLFSCIETQNDISTAVERLRFEGLIESDEQEKQIMKFTHWALNNPRVKDWYSGEWTLYNECAIIYKEGNELRTKRPDRVMMKPGEVVVVDFKFGNRQDVYNKQVKDYMIILTKMGYNNVRGFIWYVYNNELEEIR